MTTTGKTPHPVIVDEYPEQKAPRVTMDYIMENIVSKHCFTAYEGRMGSIVHASLAR